MHLSHVRQRWGRLLPRRVSRPEISGAITRAAKVDYIFPRCAPFSEIPIQAEGLMLLARSAIPLDYLIGPVLLAKRSPSGNVMMPAARVEPRPRDAK